MIQMQLNSQGQRQLASLRFLLVVTDFLLAMGTVFLLVVTFLQNGAVKLFQH
jgi:hypothetical protein